MIPIPIDAVLVETIDGWYRPPDGLNMIRRTYGDIHLSAGEVAPVEWEERNMILVQEDWLPVGRLYVNAKAWPLFKSAFEACLSLGDGYQIRTLGCFSPRLKRVNADLSTHSWGIAMDLNAEANPLSLDGKLRSDIPLAWVYEFERRGLTWGGRWKKPDAMHFQAAGPTY